MREELNDRSKQYRALWEALIKDLNDSLPEIEVIELISRIVAILNELDQD